MMERRDAIRYTAFMMGAGLSASTLAAILPGCSVDTSDTWTPTFFTPEEAGFIAELGETMLPKTTTPGAKEAMVERYLDTIRPLRYTVEDNQEFKTSLQQFMAETHAALGQDITRTKESDKLSWLTALDKSSFDYVRNQPDLPTAQRPFYLSLKEQILSGYFLSEIVAKEYFAFDPIPGPYQACIPFADVGKAWAPN